MFFPTAPLQFDPATNPPFYLSSYASPIAPIAMQIAAEISKTAQLTTIQRSAIVSAHKNGISKVKLANDFGCSRRIIYNTLKRYLEDDALENREKSGRPVIISERACTHLYL
jgi:predicted regulator of amino acid metabolism with ACT domain